MLFGAVGTIVEQLQPGQRGASMAGFAVCLDSRRLSVQNGPGKLTSGGFIQEGAP